MSPGRRLSTTGANRGPVGQLVCLGLVLGVGAAAFAAADPPTLPGPLDLAPLIDGEGVSVDLWEMSCSEVPPAGPDGESGEGRWVPFDGTAGAERTLPCDWEGIGWLRREVEIPSELVGRPIAFRAFQTGAFEAYWNERRLGAVGTVSPDPEGAEPRFQRSPLLFVPDEAGPGLLRVRWSNHRVEDLARSGLTRFFGGRLETPQRAHAAMTGTLRFQERALAGFSGIFLSFALVHFLLWVFHRPIHSNLDFSLLSVVLAALQFLLLFRWLQPDPTWLLVTEPAMNLCGLALGGTGIFFVHRLFEGRLGRIGWAYAAVALPIGIWSVVRTLDALPAVFVMMLLATGEMVRSVVVAWRRGRQGARVVGLGITVLAVGFGIGLLANLGVLPSNTLTGFFVPFGSFVVLLLVMSVHLAHRFATVHRELEARLEDVRRLSAEKLDEEQSRHRAELRHREAQLALEQKSRELEEARELQLSMLPREIPDLPSLEIAAAMETATEVGGDYYDFDLAADGTVTVAIGDATGHGLRAGTMVTATKSLFNAFAGEEGELPDTLSRSNIALKRMNLRKLAMALTLVRHRGRRMRIASAGMPPPLIWRSRTGEVESLLVGGMPLGSLARFPYREVMVELEPGDVVLLMSDGFPERLDPDGEQLGYDAATRAFAEAASGEPQEIVGALVERGKRWARGRPLDDDQTFVVLRARGEPLAVSDAGSA